MRSKQISLKGISTTVKRLEALDPNMYGDIIGTLHHDYPNIYNNIIDTLRYNICSDSNSIMIEQHDSTHKTETDARRITIAEQSLASSRISGSIL